MAAILDPLERDLKKEWDKRKEHLRTVFQEIKAWGDEVDVTAEIDAGVMKVTIEAHFNRPQTSPRSSTR